MRNGVCVNWKNNSSTCMMAVRISAVANGRVTGAMTGAVTARASTGVGKEAAVVAVVA